MLKVDVTHIDAQPGRLWILLVFEDDCVTVDGLSVKSVGVVHISQIVENIKRQVDVDLVERTSLLTKRANLFLFSCRFFCLLQGLIHVLGDFGRGGLFKKSVNLLLELLEVLLLALILLLLNIGLVSVCSGDSFWNRLAFEAG